MSAWLIGMILWPQWFATPPSMSVRAIAAYRRIPERRRRNALHASRLAAQVKTKGGFSMPAILRSAILGLALSRCARVGFALGLMVVAPLALGQKMYKCPDEKGGTTFQQSPCPETPQEAE